MIWQTAVRCALLVAILCWAPQRAFSRQAVSTSDDLQWISPDDERLMWLNVADWESRDGGLQPVRIPKAWREKWPERTGDRARSAAGVALQLRTNSQRLTLRLTFIDVPERAGIPPEELWERSRPPYFDIYRNGNYASSVAAPIRFTEQDVTIIDGSGVAPQQADLQILFPHYYRNAEVIVRGIGLARNARFLPLAPDRRPRVLFHGDSITHGHGVTSPRETYVWQACERANCIPLNLGFGGSAWADKAVADYIASRSDWEVLVIAIGTNSFAGTDSAGNPETAEQYGEKYNTFLDTIRAKFANKPILCVTPILNRSDEGPRKNRNDHIPQDYRNAIARVVQHRQKSDRYLHLLDGLKLINDPLYLMVTDAVHPNVAGSLRMADGIAAVLKTLLTRGIVRPD